MMCRARHPASISLRLIQVWSQRGSTTLLRHLRVEWRGRGKGSRLPKTCGDRQSDARARLKMAVVLRVSQEELVAVSMYQRSCDLNHEGFVVAPRSGGVADAVSPHAVTTQMRSNIGALNLRVTPLCRLARHSTSQASTLSQSRAGSCRASPASVAISARPSRAPGRQARHLGNPRRGA